MPRLQVVAAELDALEPVFRNISRNLLVRDFLVFPQHLHGQRRKKILVLITNHEQRSPQGTVRVRGGVKEAVGSRGLGQLSQARLRPRVNPPPRSQQGPPQTETLPLLLDFS